MKLTESNIRSIIENTVRKILKEEDEEKREKMKFSRNEVRSILRADMTNMAALAAELLPDWEDSSRRSYLSAFSRGEKDMDDNLFEKLTRIIQEKQKASSLK